jgi:hypothetical protein
MGLGYSHSAKASSTLRTFPRNRAIMQLSQIPTLVPLPFANSGTKNVIPVASQIGITAGAASLTDGFPPLTFTPLSAGGVPPSGADFNGILNLLSANTQWENAGGFYTYNASFSSSISGYPKNALLAQASGQGYWLSLVDNNTTDPDTGGAGWVAFSPAAIQAGAYTTGNDTGSANAYAVTLSPPPAALTPGMMVSIDNISGTNTGSSTINVNGMGALPIQGPAGAALQGGEMAVGYGALLRLNHAGTAFTLLATTGGSLPVKAATASNQAVNLGQLETLGIATNGSVAYSASTTLTSANQGQIVFYTGTAAGTFTLPAANALPAFQCKIVLSNQSSYPLTVAIPSGDGTDLSPDVLQPDQYCCVVNDGNTVWRTLWTTAGSTSPFVVGNATASNEAVNLGQLTNGSLSPTFGATTVAAATTSGEAVNLGQFIESHGTSGYEKLPGDRIRQWTTFTASAAGTNQTVTLPIAFSTAIDFVLASSQSVNSFGTASVNGTSLTTVLGSASNAGAACLVYVEGH